MPQRLHQAGIRSSSCRLQFIHGRWHRRDSQSAPCEVVARKLLQVVFADLQPFDQPGVRVAHTLDLLALDAEYAGDDRIAAFLRYEEIGHDGVLLHVSVHAAAALLVHAGRPIELATPSDTAHVLETPTELRCGKQRLYP